MKNLFDNAIAFVMLLGIVSLSAQTKISCASQVILSDDEARILLYMTPEAIGARQAGTDVEIEHSQPTRQYPAEDYFLATVVSQKPTSASVLGNGILGTFIVNRHTGEIKSMGDFATVNGKEMDRVRAWLLHVHCTQK